MDTKPTHEVTFRIERAPGLVALGKILSAGDIIGTEINVPSVEIDALVVVRCHAEEQRKGLGLAMKAAMQDEPQWGIRAIMEGQAPANPEHTSHDVAVETIKSTFVRLDAGCRRRAILEWASGADVTEVAHLIGYLQGNNVKRVIEETVRRHLAANTVDKGGAKS